MKDKILLYVYILISTLLILVPTKIILGITSICGIYIISAVVSVVVRKFMSSIYIDLSLYLLYEV